MCQDGHKLVLLMLPPCHLSCGWFPSWTHLRISTLQISSACKSSFEPTHKQQGVFVLVLAESRPRQSLKRLLLPGQRCSRGSNSRLSSLNSGRKKEDGNPSVPLTQPVSQPHQDEKRLSECSTGGIISQGYLQRHNRSLESTEVVLSYHSLRRGWGGASFMSIKGFLRR